MMNKLSTLFDKNWKINLLLFCCSFVIYFFYLHHLFLNINSVLSSITLDALKNYYTFIYHVTKDESFLHFSGMNYPYGEHVVYTDCQPLFAFIFRLLPFTHGYLAGVIHSLILLSFIFTPLVLNAVFLRLGIDKFSSFFISLAIALLSPQFWRIDGHFALSYTLFIPLSILLLLKLWDTEKRSTLLLILIYNSLLFLIHPYLGFGASIFTFVSILIFSVLNARTKPLLKNLLAAVVTGPLPVILFKLFMRLTDLHQNRTTEPHGGESINGSLAGVFVPIFGPFQDFLKKMISAEAPGFESFSYVGLFAELLIVVFILLIPFAARKMFFNKAITAMFISAFLFLLFSFGLHQKMAALLNLNLSFLNQFRALGRFAWFFYYVLPVFLITVLYHTFKKLLREKIFYYGFRILALLFFSINLLEANFLFKFNTNILYKDRNIFSEKFLNAEEKQIIKNIKAHQAQAIITLPFYYVGSELYDRIGGNPEMIPSMIYSLHTGIPILGDFLSRTSLTETEDALNLLNTYKSKRPVLPLLSNNPFFVIRTKEPMLPGEERVLKKVKFFHQQDSLEFGYLQKQDFSDPQIHKYVYTVRKNSTTNQDSSNVIFLYHESRKPYLPARISDFEIMFNLDSGKIKSGRYIASFHYHYQEKTYKYLYSTVIVAKRNQKEYVWEHTKSVRLFSGFYDGFAVFEHAFDLKRENTYEFLLKGEFDKTYRVTDFMLRPDTTDVQVIYRNGDTSLNNFPR